MPNYTTNYNLKKPLQTENYNVDDFNGNADIIDTALKNIEDTKVDVEVGKGLSDENYTLIEKNKLAGIEENATADMTALEIKTEYESNADTNAYTDAEKAKVANLPDDTIAQLADIATGEGLEDKAIIPKKASFFDEIQTKNLFTSLWELGIINDTTGQNATSTTRSRSRDYLKITPLFVHTLQFTGVTGVTYYAYYYDVNNNFLSKSTLATANKITFVPPANAEYMRLVTFKSGVIDPMTEVIPATSQLELGGTPTPYVAPKIYQLQDYLPELLITPSKTNFFKTGKNLFSGAWEINGIADTGIDRVTTTESRTSYIFVEPISEYMLTLTYVAKKPYIYVYCYDSNKQLLSIITLGFADTPRKITTPANCAYIRLKNYNATGAELPVKTQIEKGTLATEYEDYKISLDDEYLNPLSVKTRIETQVREIVQYKNDYVKGIAHRGYSIVAPENTYHAYVLAKKMGFEYVETDIQFTSDGVPVLFHDTTLDIKSSGTGAIADHTLAELKAMDFGAWKNEVYAGTKIMTFEEFLKLIKKLNLKAYLDLKAGLTQAQAELMVNLAKKYGVLRGLSWMGSFIHTDNVRLYDPKARIGALPSVAPTDLSAYVSRLTDDNNVYINVDYSIVTQDFADLCTANGIGLEVWIVNDPAVVAQMLDYNVQGISTDILNIPKVIADTFVAP